MNSGLKVCDTVIVVPIFFAFYTTLALLNGNVYMDQWGEYDPWKYAIIIIGIFILVGGVYLLSRTKELYLVETILRRHKPEAEGRPTSPIIIVDEELAIPENGKHFDKHEADRQSVDTMDFRSHAVMASHPAQGSHDNHFDTEYAADRLYGGALTNVANSANASHSDNLSHLRDEQTAAEPHGAQANPSFLGLEKRRSSQGDAHHLPGQCSTVDKKTSKSRDSTE
jgi:hypothetical protein